MKKLFILLLIAPLFLPSCKDGEETPNYPTTTLMNDSYTSGGQITFEDGFAATEKAAATLGPVNDDYQIKNVSFMFGGAAGTRDVQIFIYKDAGTSNPLDLMYSGIHSITASDDAFQVIDLTSHEINSAKGRFRVVIEMSASGLPCVATDDQTSILAENWMMIKTSGVWRDPKNYGIDNNFIIRSEIFLK